MIQPLYTIVLLSLLSLACRQEVSAPVHKNAVRYLALGNSYTIGESVPEKARFPVQLRDSLQANGVIFEELNIIARTGWTTGDLLSALANQKVSGNYDLVSLLIGVNNQYQGRSIEEYEREFRMLLDSAVAKAGNDKSKVFVLSIPDYGYTPFGEDDQPTISPEIDSFNKVNKRITDSAGISYYNITPISRRGLDEPALVASDGLHPSGKQYNEWIQLIYDGVEDKLRR